MPDSDSSPMDSAHPHGSPTVRQRDPAVERARDPVCGMCVDWTATPHRAEHAGRSYFFCGAKCRERFVAEPERYLPDEGAARERMASAAAAGTQWTCPMHPEIVRDRPGSCPICGMALEPMTPVAGKEVENPELR